LICLLLDTQNKTKQQNNNNPKTKATATDQRNKILYNKSLAAAAAVAVLFPFAKNSLLCNPPILSFATNKILQKQTSKLTYLLLQQQFPSYIS
jgi:hypothetical protein